MDLADIYDSSCEACPLHKNEGRTCISGSGNLQNPTVLVVGDGPSKEEATKVRAFTDQRAKLLRAALEDAGIEVSASGEVFATYMCKCFPAGKVRTVDARVCADKYLLKEIAHFKPKLILALGKNAQLILLHESSPLSKTHGKIFDVVFEVDGETIETKVMPIEHPFAILSNPAKISMWESDIQRAKSVLYNEGEPFWAEEKKDRFDFNLIESPREFKQLAKHLIQNYKGSYLALDIEASGLDDTIQKEEFKVYTIQFGIVDMDSKPDNDILPVYILPIQSEQFACTKQAGWLPDMVNLLNNFLHPRYFKLVAHNGKYDLKGLRRIGVTTPYLTWDTMMLWANAYGEAPMSLKEIAYQVSDLGGYEVEMQEYFKEHGTFDAPPELLVPYGGLDIVVTRHLMYDMYHKLLKES